MARVHVHDLTAAQVLDADDAALDADDRPVAVVLGDPDRAPHGRGGELAARAEAPVAAAEQRADRLAASGDRGERIDAAQPGPARIERAAMQLELGDGPGRPGLGDGE